LHIKNIVIYLHIENCKVMPTAVESRADKK